MNSSAGERPWSDEPDPPRPEATHAITLTPLKESCQQCGQPLWVGYHGHRTVTKLDGLWKLTIVVRRCMQPECPCYHLAYRPEEEGGTAAWRIWPGGDCLDWPLAFSRTSQRARDAV